MILKIFKMYKCLIWTLYICTPPMLEANKYDHYTTDLQANELSSPSDNLGFSLKLYLFLKLLSFSIKSVGHCINNLVCNFNLSIFPKNLLEIKNYPYCFIFIHYTVMLNIYENWTTQQQKSIPKFTKHQHWKVAILEIFKCTSLKKHLSY